MKKEVVVTATGERLVVEEPIGAVKNNWRLRRVTIYAHPTDPAKVVTVGVGFRDPTGRFCGSDCVAVESWGDWLPNIGKFNVVEN